MFEKVLIANRGEIALRIMRTCAALGIRTVAVYSDADRDAPHVLAADEAVRLGSAEPRESYLSIARVIAAARETGAQGLHPGYGFLSERAEFAEACASAGIVFVGPPAEAMRRLGDKIGARRLAVAHGVPVAPGYDGEDQDPATLRAAAERIGLPLLIKASAGGGGRGMRRVDRLEDFESALDAARREAEQAFGDGRVFLEKLITTARHVEVQVLADSHGAAVALGDRDCSLQRRHQKLVEEAPAPHLSAAMRVAMHQAATQLALAAGYVNAGTVEFLVQGERFTLLEVNARLQVEHTVTEMVTGLDLVAAQLRIAAGASLDQALLGDEGRRTQDESGTALPSCVLRPSSLHAIEARIYAEDPANHFLPEGGVVERLHWPAGPGIRVDAGITAAGQRVSESYDPLLAKIICWGSDREAALARLDAALSETVVLGVPSTTGTLRRICAAPAFRQGALDTGFLDAHPDLTSAIPPPPAALAVAASAVLTGTGPWRTLAGWRQAQPRCPIRFEVRGAVYDAFAPTAAPQPGTPTASPTCGPSLHDVAAVLPFRTPDGRRGVEVAAGGERWQLWLDVPRAPAVDAERIAAPEAGETASAPRESLSDADNWFVTAPLSGKTGAHAAEAGGTVEAQATLTMIEAMKMQHAVLAGRAARVVRWLVEPGTFARAGQPLVELAPREASPPG